MQNMKKVAQTTHVSPRNIKTQHGQRSRVNPSNRLNPLTILQQNGIGQQAGNKSLTNGSLSNKQTRAGLLRGSAKRLRKSADNYGNSTISNVSKLNNVNLSWYQGGAPVGNTGTMIPLLEGQQLRSQVQNPNMLTLD